MKMQQANRYGNEIYNKRKELLKQLEIDSFGIKCYNLFQYISEKI